MCFFNGVTRVVFGVWFILTAKIGNSSNDFFCVVSTSEGTFCIGPVMLRLGQRGTGSAMLTSRFFIMVSGGILRFNRNLEIPQMVCLRRFRMGLHKEILVVFFIGEAGKSKHPRRICCCWVAAELPDHCVLQSLRF